MVELEVDVLAGFQNVLDGVLGGELVVVDEDFVEVVGFDVGQRVDLLGFADFQPNSLLFLQVNQGLLLLTMPYSPLGPSKSSIF